MFTWGGVYAEQYRHADLAQDMRRAQLAEEATKANARLSRRLPSSQAKASLVFALLMHIIPHVTRS